MSHQGKDPLIQEQDSARGNSPVPRTAPGPGDAGPFETGMPPLRPGGGAGAVGDGPRSG